MKKMLLSLAVLAMAACMFNSCEVNEDVLGYEYGITERYVVSNADIDIRDIIEDELRTIPGANLCGAYIQFDSNRDMAGNDKAIQEACKVAEEKAISTIVPTMTDEEYVRYTISRCMADGTDVVLYDKTFKK